jgi:hypothetical protein
LVLAQTRIAYSLPYPGLRQPSVQESSKIIAPSDSAYNDCAALRLAMFEMNVREVQEESAQLIRSSSVCKKRREHSLHDSPVKSCLCLLRDSVPGAWASAWLDISKVDLIY